MPWLVIGGDNGNGGKVSAMYGINFEGLVRGWEGVAIASER